MTGAVQLSLFDVSVVTLTCAFGSPWGPRGCGPCDLCVAYADALEALFQRKVADGVFDAAGYTPNERKAQRQRARSAA